MRTINKIIIHCSATPEGKDFRAKDIDLWHKQRGFTGIGYHYVIDLDGTVEKGRDEALVGAHCVGQNQYSIGICYIGGLDKDGKAPKDTRTKAQKRALKTLVNNLKNKYTVLTIHGHNEFANKACPCFNVSRDL